MAKLVDFVRAGALAAGVATFVGVWFQGMKILGFRGPFPDGLGDFLMMTVAGIIFGAVFGFSAPAARPISHVARVAGTTVSGIVCGVAIGALAYLLVGVFDVAERNLPPFFLVIGAALVGGGLRRIPRTLEGRAALGILLGVLVMMRILAMWPTGAHALTRRLFPLPESTVRAEFERRACGELCDEGRTHIVSFESKALYDVYYDRLQGEGQVKAGVEVDKPFFQDLCGQVYDQPPTVLESVRAHKTLQACYDAHPREPPIFDTVPRFEPSPCCRLEVRARRPGDRIDVSRTLLFVFHAMAWESVD